MRKLKISVNGKSYEVEVEETGACTVLKQVANAPTVAPATKEVPTKTVVASQLSTSDTPVTAPLPGKVTTIVAKQGDSVKKGDTLMILEAMKMQNEIGSPASGTVKSINVTNGQTVKPKDILAVIS